MAGEKLARGGAEAADEADERGGGVLSARAIGCALLMIALPVLALVIHFQLFIYNLARDRIPAALDVGYFYEGSNGDPCGMVSFALGSGAAAQIERAPGAFFAKGFRARDIYWRNWQRTPSRAPALSRPWVVHGCGATVSASRVEDELKTVLSQPGSYFSIYDEGILIVDPRGGRVFYGYRFK